ncbi:hypothetical protein [Kitasatospora sp. A2-31]|uniref:hypothetical protein n=1 Tax=Kitasatospora sp. A2-31 TaxID=2916414 RepID=UPI001EED286F|nr:hypothetical protein [Kitasatospora sp. A2-31]MCG6498888.1 hypothetical protein [Kitasatospora sp. A2-31]MCG6499479.1 hypothetical protein [Kitasatospora sp. A2-31]MCG6500201.1 hypothetical protein [Kitasatospora sp. A2-31]
MTVAQRPETPPYILITLDTSRAGRYVSAECQLDAHHGCPGGLWDEAGARVLVCLCGHPGCSCARNLPGADQ